MTPERWQRIKELFGAAAALDPATRAAYLDENGGDDAGLRAEVASLLATHDRSNAVLDLPAAAYVTGTGGRAGAEQWIGQRLGAYELIALLGHGGMGEVYRARRVDAEYEKEVAIKLVPAGFQAEHVLQRLRTERQILASLEHPNIARLIDGGASPQGVPYLVLELVDGVPIDRYCADLPLEQKLALFRSVCEAVSYAHQRLIVHRDLKPGNILVTVDGSVKLLDFGIAKLLQRSAGDAPAAAERTLFQTFTPGFASPEQVLGKPITTASDVYSLGVLLYLLLAGRGPYRGNLDTTQDAIREICEIEPAPPGGGRDLDAICLRALRKEPDKRYRSVEELSEDVRRHLAGLPVIARGDRFGYRAGKFLRRHRIELAAAALVAASLVGGTVFSLREARVAVAERARAERHFQSVRALADTFMFQVHDAIEPLPGSTEARGLLVDTSLRYLNTLASEAGGDRTLQLDLANAYMKVANIQGQAYAANTGKQREALESYGKSLALAEQLLAGDPGNLAARRVAAKSLIERSRLLLMFGDTKEALAASRGGIARYEALAQAGLDDEIQSDLAQAYSVHALTLDYTGGDAESREFTLKATAQLEDLVSRRPKDLEMRRRLGIAYSMAAATFLTPEYDREKTLKALDMHRKAFEIDDALATETAFGNSAILKSLSSDHANLNNLLNFVGDYAAARPHCDESRALIARLRVDTKNAETDLHEALVRMHCARTLRGLGKLDEAQEMATRNVVLLKALAARNDNLQVQYVLGASEALLAGRAAQLGETRRARDLYRSALARFEPVMAAVTLDALDRASIDEARAGLQRVENAK